MSVKCVAERSIVSHSMDRKEEKEMGVDGDKGIMVLLGFESGAILIYRLILTAELLDTIHSTSLEEEKVELTDGVLPRVPNFSIHFLTKLKAFSSPGMFHSFY